MPGRGSCQNRNAVYVGCDYGAAEVLSGATAEPMQLAVAGTLRSSRFGNTADAWQPGGMTVNLNNEFHTHDSLSESELTREAESMAQRLKWAIP